jgi:hypothetical protein
MSPRWRLGTEICLDCDYQGDWIYFLEDITPEKIAEIYRIAELSAAIDETMDRAAGKQPE